MCFLPWKFSFKPFLDLDLWFRSSEISLSSLELCSRIFRVALLFICQGTSKADRCAIILESLLSQNVLCNEMLCDSTQRAVFFCKLSLLLCCFVLFVSPATMYTISSSPMIVNTNFKNFSDIFRQASKALIL